MPKGTINEFRTEILKGGGIQVASHFEIEMAALPKRLLGNQYPTNFTNQLRFRCENVSLPDVTVNTIETHRFGIGTADIVPYGLSYLEATATFIGDQNGAVYEFFYDWANAIMKMPDAPTASRGISGGRRDTTYEVGFKSDIVVEEFKIIAYDWQHTPIYTATLFDAFPRSILTTALNWAAGDELVRYTVFLSFKDFKLELQ